MAYNFQDDMALGRLGSAYINVASGAYTPPTGMVVVQILVVANTKFTVLKAEQPGDATYKGPLLPSGAVEAGGMSFSTTGNTTAANGTNFTAFPTGTTFSAGTVFFGRWSAIDLASTPPAGAIIVYLGY